MLWVYSVGHSGQLSPIESSTSAIATAAACEETPRGRTLAGDIESALAGVWIGAVLHPAVLLTLVDGACFLQHRDCPAVERPDRGAPFNGPKHRVLLPSESLAIGLSLLVLSQSSESSP
jgi:hypothetical protein